MSDIATVENAIISTLDGLSIFANVVSVANETLNVAYKYPRAYVFFISDSLDSDAHRPDYQAEFGVSMVVKNLQTEALGKTAAYTIIDAAKTALHGKTLSVSSIQPLKVISRTLTDFDNGILTYLMRVTTRIRLGAITAG